MKKYLLINIFLFGQFTSIYLLNAQTIAHQELSYKSVTLSALKRPVSVKALPEFNLLLITDGSAGLDEPVLYAYTLDSIKFIKSFITLGYGDNQVITSGTIQHLMGDSLIRMFDINMQRFCEIPIDSILKPNAKVPIIRQFGRDSANKKIALNDFKYKSPYFLRETENIIDLNTVLSASFQFLLKEGESNKVDPTMFKIFSKNGTLQSEIGRLPKEIIAETEKTNINRFVGGLDINDRGNIIIYRSFFSNFIALYDVKGYLLAQLNGLSNNEPTDNKNKILSEKAGYLSVVARMYNDKVYAINVFPKNINSNDGKKMINLYIFDKQLNPLKRLLIRGGEISFDIDPSTGYIYSLDNKELFISHQ